MLVYQPRDGYCYNSDSIFLFDFIQSFSPRGKLLDVGSGCGVIGLLLAKFCKVELQMVEKQDMMAFYSQKNSEVNRIEARMHQGDFLEMAFEGEFDVVVSNPPFWDSAVMQSENDHINACRYTHHLPFEAFAEKVKRVLRFRGDFFFCYDAKQLPRIMQILMEMNLRPEVIRMVHSKQERDAGIFFCKATKGSRAQTKVMRPLIVFEGNEYVKEAQTVFDQVQTHTIKCDIEEKDV